MEDIMKNIFLTYAQHIRLSRTVQGILFLISGILSIFNQPSIEIFTCIVLILSLLCMIFTTFSRKEKEDEMAQANIYRAEHYATSIMTLFLLLIPIALFFVPNHVYSHLRWEHVFGLIYILIGFKNIITGILFKRFEEH